MSDNTYKVLAIDPGNVYSAYVLVEVESLVEKKYKILEKGKVENKEIFLLIDSMDLLNEQYDLVIEMIASYGMAVGKTVFDTVFWIGRFYERSESENKNLMFRKDIKMHLCNSTRAKDANISQSLRDRFGEKGTKKNPGYFYGFKADEWAAFAVFVTYVEMGSVPF